MSQLPSEIALIGEEDLRRLGKVDLVMAEMAMSRSLSSGHGTRDSKIHDQGYFRKLLRLLHWWQCKQSTPVGYILENVPPLGHVGLRIQEDAQVVCRHLGSPMLVDAPALGSYAHRLQWKWTNLVSMQGVSAALQQLVRPTGQYVDDILDT